MNEKSRLAPVYFLSGDKAGSHGWLWFASTRLFFALAAPRLGLRHGRGGAPTRLFFLPAIFAANRRLPALDELRRPASSRSSAPRRAPAPAPPPPPAPAFALPAAALAAAATARPPSATSAARRRRPAPRPFCFCSFSSCPAQPAFGAGGAGSARRLVVVVVVVVVVLDHVVLLVVGFLVRARPSSPRRPRRPEAGGEPFQSSGRGAGRRRRQASSSPCRNPPKTTRSGSKWPAPTASHPASPPAPLSPSSSPSSPPARLSVVPARRVDEGASMKGRHEVSAVRARSVAGVAVSAADRSRFALATTAGNVRDGTSERRQRRHVRARRG